MAGIGFNIFRLIFLFSVVVISQHDASVILYISKRMPE